MKYRFKALRRQSGAALIVLLALLLLASAAILLDRLQGQVNASTRGHDTNAKALAEAKAALIAWAVTYPATAARESTPGNLPYPDRDGDGRYDGFADCDSLGVNDLVLVGRLPRSGEDDVSVGNCGVINPLNIDVRDAAGEPLWYAVSRNVLAGIGVAGGPINPDMGEPGRMAYPWIRLRDAQGNLIMDPMTPANPLAVVAVIFAPGAALEGQDRSATAAANYLDSIAIGGATYDNADADGCPDNTTAPCGSAGEEFVVYPNPQSGEAFNDELVYITVGELMRAVEKRVLGDMALTLEQFRAAGWNTNNDYPWLREFRNPRAGTTGTATGGSATHLDDSAADFVADGIQVGDVVINTGSGSGVVTGVTTTRVDFTALLGGLDITFNAGEGYQILPSFETNAVAPLTRRGQLPIHLPGEIFKTGFTAVWDLSDIDDYGEGMSSLQPDDDDIQNYNITVAENDGRCMWSEANHVECYGEQFIPSFFRSDLGFNVQRLIQVQFSFTGSDDSGNLVPATISLPTTSNVRRRNVSIDSDGSPAIPFTVPVAAPGLPQDLYPAGLAFGETWTIRVTDTNGGNSGTTLLVIDADTDGDISVSGIRYDLSVVYDNIDDAKDEVPEWFAENNWHHYIYAAFSPDRMAGGDADADDNCTTPANACVKLNVGGAASRTDIPALLIATGLQWTNQDRALGDCDGDGGGPLTDPTDDSYLCAYLDSDTSLYDVSAEILRHGQNALAVTADWYTRDVFGNGFNDQIRIIE